MKTLVPLIVGILLAVGVVKLSRPADPAHPAVPTEGTPEPQGLDPALVSEQALREAWSIPAESSHREPGKLAALASGAPATELRAGRQRLEARYPQEAQRHALFDRLRAAQAGSQSVSLEDLDALLSGTGLEEEDLSDGVLMPMDWSGDFDELGAFDAVGLTREEGAALMSEGLRKGWF